MDLDKLRIEVHTRFRETETLIEYLCNQILIQQQEIQILKEKQNGNS